MQLSMTVVITAVVLKCDFTNKKKPMLLLKLIETVK